MGYHKRPHCWTGLNIYQSSPVFTLAGPVAMVSQCIHLLHAPIRDSKLTMAPSLLLSFLLSR